MGMQMSADLTNMGEYMGVVGGMLKAMEDPRFQGDFVNHITTKVKRYFMTETIAVNMSGARDLSHVFEWGAQDGRGVATGKSSDIPLFRLTKSGLRDTQLVGYEFLPSMKPVPLPSPEKYGFKPNKLNYMRRHVFQLKALVMETRSAVIIAPVGSKKLFIPTTSNKRGYIMTSSPVRVNPGGSQATGQFSEWWRVWFETRAPKIVKAEAELTEQMLAETGRKLVRYAAGTVINGEKVGGRFVSSKGVSISFVNAKAEEVKREVMNLSARYFDEDKWAATWD